MENMENTQFCQSCGMPLAEGLFGTEADGKGNEDYCKYCYEGGKYTVDCTMEEMIGFCVDPVVEQNPGMTKEAAKEAMEKFFPQLKRWKN